MKQLNFNATLVMKNTIQFRLETVFETVPLENN